MKAAPCLIAWGMLMLCGMGAADPAAGAPKSKPRLRVAKAGVVGAAPSALKASSAEKPAASKKAPAPLPPYHGWDFLAEKLKADGVAEETIRAVFESPRMPLSERIPFALTPRDTTAIYLGFVQPARLSG